MTRVRVAAVAAGLTVAMVVGVLVGGALSTADAQAPFTVTSGGVTLCPNGDPVALANCIEEYRASLAEPKDAAKGDAAEAEAEAVQCSIVDGCTVELVDEDGEVVRVMHITFSDPEDADTAEISLE